MYRRSLFKSNLIYYLLVLIFLYVNMICTFALIYLFLDATGYGSVVDHFSHYKEWRQDLDPLAKHLYFSAVTLLSVGYGDITPFGWSKLVAIIEAMFGYILPATLVLEYIRPLFKGKK